MPGARIPGDDAGGPGTAPPPTFDAVPLVRAGAISVEGLTIPLVVDLTWDPGPGDGLLQLHLSDGASAPEDDRSVEVVCVGDAASARSRCRPRHLRELPARGGAFLFLFSASRGDVVAGDWQVGLTIADYATVYGSVELQ
jgi:hypothetical protein